MKIEPLIVAAISLFASVVTARTPPCVKSLNHGQKIIII